MKKKLLIIIVIVVVLCAAGIAAFSVIQSRETAKSQESAAPATTKAALADISVIVPASGKFEPKNYVTVRPDATMPTRKVTKVSVKARDVVTKGQSLAEVDRSGLSLDVDKAKSVLEAARYKLTELKSYPKPEDRSQAESDLRQAKLDLTLKTTAYEGAKKLFDSQYASKSELQTAEKNLKLAEDTLKTAQYKYNTVIAGSSRDTIKTQEAALASAQTASDEANLIYDSTIIRAPMSGTVASVSILVGDLVSASSNVNGTTSLMTIADLGTMTLKAQVDENDIGSIKTGQRAIVRPAGGTTSVEGVVREIDAVSDSSNTSVTVFLVSIDVPNVDNAILWGMNGDVEIVSGEALGALCVPSAAIKTIGGKKVVMTLREGKAAAQEVSPGISDGTNTQILGGLSQGDLIIIPTRASSSSSASGTKAGQTQGFGAMGLGGGPGGPPPH